MTYISKIRTFFSIALLAIIALGTGCSGDDVAQAPGENAEGLGSRAEDIIVQRARDLADDTRAGAAEQAEADKKVAAIGHSMGRALNEEAREVTGAIRSGADALAAEANSVTEAIKHEASKLAGTTDEARAVVAGIANEIEDNVEDSNEIYDEAYEAARESGQNVIEAGGEAYNAVETRGR